MRKREKSVQKQASLVLLSADTFARVMDLNVKGAFNATHAAAECVVARGQDVILSTSSMVSISAQPAALLTPHPKLRETV